MLPMPKQPVRSIDTRHAIREFAQGVGLMAETGNTVDAAALAASLTDGFAKHLEKTMREYAAVTQKPKLPTWVTTLLVGLAGSLIVGLAGGLLTYGALQNRVTNLENKTSNIDRLNSLDAKVDLLTGEFERMESRFNALMDGQKRDK
jgi:hypothetical protein